MPHRKIENVIKATAYYSTHLEHPRERGAHRGTAIEIVLKLKLQMHGVDAHENAITSVPSSHSPKVLRALNFLCNYVLQCKKSFHDDIALHARSQMMAKREKKIKMSANFC